MLFRILTSALQGVEAHAVHVEADVSPGIPHTQIVGLPDASVRESRDRVHAAVRNSGYEMPPARITLNLAPAGLPKEGSGFDLPIALALLAASGQIPGEGLERRLFLGELSLDGSLRPVRGVLVAAVAARRMGAAGIVVSVGNRREALSVEGLEVGAAGSLREAAERAADPGFHERGQASEGRARRPGGVDLADVRGQDEARRALEIAAAGGHNLFMVGPPGAGKTMLARRLSTVLPPLAGEDSLEATMIHSIAGVLSAGGAPLHEPPFRAPHHTVSDVGLVGGGNPPRPGEVSLAHRGVLFLDELPEFRRSALEALRQPAEDGRVSVVRAGRSAVFPARFQLVAAMNPCPCGKAGEGPGACRCTSTEIRRYRARLSGPLLDRVDLHVRVPAVGLERLTGGEPGESSESVRERVEAARRAQYAGERGAGGRGVVNAELSGRDLERACALPAGGKALLATALRRRGLSARGVHRVMRVARTIADLADAEEVALPHLAEAVRYRVLPEVGTGATRPGDGISLERTGRTAYRRA
ncbi:MAG: YifB family Mg chelatase-like AAA ATPase [Gemmatimonadota bacterium]|nr:hypothetical protein [Gemmatimonadota bacterium]MDP6461644.1 YifB family Mg chelatase-like AAA ATPase [Gemmatimonadota bacterium]MDP6528899.1 YifB family Mg chelatase-like AAA ATPase [Gemmatimonadota bacterium]MDP6803260.1 YifB family Mg chelatase-like AAA ATPase [Gemmatimonadota bacterium]MDP7032660.1 YifB family Mg chelatase-like AAA ATPase [Gemmatimonadota bacterium]